MKTTRFQQLALSLLLCASATRCLAQASQLTLPEGTKIRVRLEQDLSSATAEEGQPVQLSVAEDVRVEDVAVDEISLADLKKIFLISKTSLGSAHVTPILLKGGPTHQAFVKECLGESDQDLQDYYKNLAFTGKAVAPKAVTSDAELIAFVALSKGAIGYVSATAIPVGVKKLTVK